MHGFADYRRAALVVRRAARAGCHAAVVACVCAGGIPAHAETCPTAGAEPVALASVAPRLELKLADGRLLRLAGLEAAAGTPAAPDRDATDAATLAAIIGRQLLAVTILSPKPDRWGRLLAFASVADGPAGGLAAAALSAGVARYRPEAAVACRAALLAAEDAARRAKRGLWADPFYSVLAADDRAAFAARAGTDVVAEVRLRDVEPSPYRTRLRFEASNAAQSRSRGLLEATIVPRAMKTFEARGVDVHSLVGRSLRLRGLLDRRFGPRIELAGPDEIEVLPETAAPARPN